MRNFGLYIKSHCEAPHCEAPDYEAIIPAETKAQAVKILKDDPALREFSLFDLTQMVEEVK